MLKNLFLLFSVAANICFLCSFLGDSDRNQESQEVGTFQGTDHYRQARVLLQENTRTPVQIEEYDLVTEIRRYQGVRHPGFIVAPANRNELGKLLDALGGFKVGVELGVQQGIYSERIMQTWTSCEKYYMVDLWAPQVNYAESGNVGQDQQDRIFAEAQRRLEPWKEKAVFIKNFTSSAASMIPDRLDFVYVDARHDYCGAMEDISMYWPKIRPGGIMAGHDYASARDQQKIHAQEDWSLCMDGSRNKGAVMGAVNEFAMEHGLAVSVAWGEPFIWRTWVIRKPFRKPHSHMQHTVNLQMVKSSH